MAPLPNPLAGVRGGGTLVARSERDAHDKIARCAFGDSNAQHLRVGGGVAMKGADRVMWSRASCHACAPADPAIPGLLDSRISSTPVKFSSLPVSTGPAQLELSPVSVLCCVKLNRSITGRPFAGSLLMAFQGMAISPRQSASSIVWA